MTLFTLSGLLLLLLSISWLSVFLSHAMRYRVVAWKVWFVVMWGCVVVLALFTPWLGEFMFESDLVGREPFTLERVLSLLHTMAFFSVSLMGLALGIMWSRAKGDLEVNGSYLSWALFSSIVLTLGAGPHVVVSLAAMIGLRVFP
jgi:hypothetical protein